MKKTLMLAAASACLLLPTPSQATIIQYGLYDTGVDSSGNSLGTASVDSHYTLDSSSAVVVDGTSFPIPPWLTYVPANGNSRWISVDSSGGNANLPIADHVYLTTFTLSSVPSSIVLSGEWSSDNASDVYLNGNLLGSKAFQDSNGYSFTHYDSFSTANAGFFLAGANILEFIVHNGDINQPVGNPGGWFGLRTQDLTIVPEPTTMIAGALLLLPFGASTLRILRKNRAA
jgi:hypothetical protein